MVLEGWGWGRSSCILLFTRLFALELLILRHFAQWDVDEEKVLESWISHMNTDRDVRELGAVKK